MLEAQQCTKQAQIPPLLEVYSSGGRQIINKNTSKTHKILKVIKLGRKSSRERDRKCQGGEGMQIVREAREELIRRGHLSKDLKKIRVQCMRATPELGEGRNTELARE